LPFREPFCMTPESTTATDAARRLWVRNAGGRTDPEAVAAAAEGACADLRIGLGCWIGVGGHRVLVARALMLARQEHPVLDGISGMGGDQEVVTAAVRSHGAGTVAEGMVALMASLIVLLGRIIGEEMALQLVEHPGPPHPRRSLSNGSQGGPDD
jgi:hypothetical protein